jgi:hypothetical protein
MAVNDTWAGARASIERLKIRLRWPLRAWPAFQLWVRTYAGRRAAGL